MAKQPLDEEEYQRWRDEADRALEGSRLQMNGGLYNWPCFAAEQSAQLAMKGLLHGIGQGPSSHDLVRLGDIAENAGVTLTKEVADTLRRGVGRVGSHKRCLNRSLSSLIRSGRQLVADIIAKRREEQQHLIALARELLERLSGELPILAAAVVGSVARGDFNVWSDVDVVVVSDSLPPRAPDRGALLAKHAPARVQAVGFTPKEFERACSKKNALAIEALERGLVLSGEDFFASRREVGRVLPKTIRPRRASI